MKYDDEISARILTSEISAPASGIGEISVQISKIDDKTSDET